MRRRAGDAREAVGPAGGTATTEVARAPAVRGGPVSGAPAPTAVTDALGIADELAVDPSSRSR
ncbi:hypothetical protein SUDANB6_05310 [Streptomyces sp. enrichment culture]